MTASVRSRLDREVRELLRDHPELIAVAELIASPRPEYVNSAAPMKRAPQLRLSRAVRAFFWKPGRRSSR